MGEILSKQLIIEEDNKKDEKTPEESEDDK